MAVAEEDTIERDTGEEQWKMLSIDPGSSTHIPGALKLLLWNDKFHRQWY